MLFLHASVHLKNHHHHSDPRTTFHIAHLIYSVHSSFYLDDRIGGLIEVL